ncbi:MAG: polysaccharide deacetylase family protein, partial [Candidatus Melainabacteria bacterium]|nr:polysaccharide deacetylase family protein [Candidatus Melainabacteria bacterium]
MTLMPQAPEFLRGVKTPRTLMLLYHRINDLTCDPQLLSVTPEHFDQHLQVLQKKYRVVNSSHLVELDHSRKVSANSVVVTFDDGYADNLTQALPLLEKHEVPATVFVTTGVVEQRKHFWWDELSRLVLGEHDVPDKLQLTLEKSQHWNFSDIERWSDLRATGWNLTCAEDPTSRHQLYRDLSHFLRGASEQERDRVLESLRNWVCFTAPGASDCMALTADELIELSKVGSIEIGSHTVHHPVLSNLSSMAQESELRDSKQYLESLLGREVSGFAYPYGTKSDYTLETTELVKKVGYRSACSNIAEAIWAGTDSFQFPRLLVRDCDASAFEKSIGEWFGVSFGEN